MKTAISILIPTFNDDCFEVVSELARQASEISSLAFEIIVADDGSTDEAAVSRNRQIETLANCRFLRQAENRGRAAIRNLLAREARHEWLLFIDSGMGIVRPDFLKTYLSTEKTPVYGGYVVVSDSPNARDNLRYRYEAASAPNHALANRLKNPNRDFHTSNFLVSRQLFLQHPLDERFRHYGYEDVFWGKQLSEAGITIHHIDNPVAFDRFESNGRFLDKTEEGLRTLHQFRDELEGYSRLLKTAKIIQSLHLTPLCNAIFAQKQERWRNALCASPSLRLFKYYKMLYFLSL